MADPTEAPTPKPPTDTPMPEAPMPMDSMPPEMPPAGDGVGITMPMEAFEAIHMLVTQLAQALDAAAANVQGQKSEAMGSPMPPDAPTGGPGSPAGGMSPDEADLASFAQELSARNT